MNARLSLILSGRTVGSVQQASWPSEAIGLDPGRSLTAC